MAGGDGAAWMATGNRSGFRQARRRALTERGGVSAPRTVDAPGRLRRGLGRATSRPVRPGAPVSAQPNPLCARLCAAPPCAAQPLLAQPSPSLRNPAPPCATQPSLPPGSSAPAKCWLFVCWLDRTAVPSGDGVVRPGGRRRWLWCGRARLPRRYRSADHPTGGRPRGPEAFRFEWSSSMPGVTGPQAAPHMRAAPPERRLGSAGFSPL